MFKPKPKLPARLHFFFAREAPIGVIFREGPRKRIRLILWHTDTDIFEPGHWFLGQIYFDQVDLSPDGKLLIYCAYKWHQSEADGYSDAWIAISKPPFLTALALWPISWGRATGEFLDNQTVRLNGSVSVEPHPKHPLASWMNAIHQPIPNWDRCTKFGWRRIVDKRPEKYPYPYEKFVFGDRFILRYQRRMGRWPLYTLYDSFEKTSQELEVQYAEIDPQGRLIVARGGKLLALNLPSLEETELADFNDMAFEAIPPPEWATKW